MRTYWVLAGCLLTVSVPCWGQSAVAGPATREAASTQPTPRSLQQCIDLMLQAIDHAEGLLPEMAAAADAAARRWIAGADLFVGGDLCASEEAFYRAGGLIGLRRIGPVKQNNYGLQVRWDDVPEESVVFYEMHRNADPKLILFDDLGHLMHERDTVVFFGSSQWLACQRAEKALRSRLTPEKFFFIDTQLPKDTSLTTADSRHYGDYAGMATAVHMWAFTAEMVAACTRQNKTPGIWPSGAIPRYEAWEKKYENTKFHDDLTVQPIEAGTLGRQYLRILREQVKACSASGAQVRAAAKMLAGVPSDRAVYTMVESHLLAGETWLPKELPNWLLVQRGWRWRRAVPTVEKGDAILWLGYLDWPGGEIGRAAQMQNPFVAVSVYGPGQRGAKREPLITPETGNPAAKEPRQDVKVIKLEPPTPAQDPATLPPNVVWVRAPWQYPDAVVEIDSYPLPACPTSSIVQGTLLWGLVGEVLQMQGTATQAAR
jgi:hypothetical protein